MHKRMMYVASVVCIAVMIVLVIHLFVSPSKDRRIISDQVNPVAIKKLFSAPHVIDDSFRLKSFLGYRFGAVYEGKDHRKLSKQFRAFDEVSLIRTNTGVLRGVGLHKQFVDIEGSEVFKELSRLIALFQDSYGIAFDGGAHQCGVPLVYVNSFDSIHFYRSLTRRTKIDIGAGYDGGKKLGVIFVNVNSDGE